MPKFVLLTLSSILLATSAFAVDGVVLINQSTVLASGGFPFQISQSGSYKLSGNLTVPAATNGIQISAAWVTLDLNGFSITTPDAPFGPPFFRGISYNAAFTTPHNIVIRGGNVDGFSLPIQLIGPTGIKCQYCAFTDLITRIPSGGASWELGNYTRIDNVTALNTDINVICPSVVVNTVADHIGLGAPSPGNPNPPNQGACTFANNATLP
jgi:hypothetical protein